MQAQEIVTAQGLRARAAELATEVGRFGPRSVPTDLRLQHVLICATVLFTEHGYEATSMNDVAQAAGISKPVVYDLFESKDALFGAVMESAVDDLLLRMEAAIVAEPDPVRHFEAAGRAYFAFVREREDAWSHLLTSQATIVSDWVTHIRVRSRTFIADVIVRNLESTGRTVSRSRADALAQLLMGALESLAWWWVTHPEIALDTITEFFSVAMGRSFRVLSDSTLSWPDTNDDSLGAHS